MSTSLETARREAADHLQRMMRQRAEVTGSLHIRKSLDLVILGEALSSGAFNGHSDEEWDAIGALYRALCAERST